MVRFGACLGLSCQGLAGQTSLLTTVLGQSANNVLAPFRSLNTAP